MEQGWVVVAANVLYCRTTVLVMLVPGFRFILLIPRGTKCHVITRTVSSGTKTTALLQTLRLVLVR